MESKEEKGARGETRFAEWLDNNSLGYIYIKQDIESYAKLFGALVKRPDFLVLFESIGLIAVDVKNYKLCNDDYFTLNMEREIKKVLAFERLFRLPVWYAYMGNEQGTDWHWLSALRAVEAGGIAYRKDEGTYLKIPLNEFVPISTRQDIGRLWIKGTTPVRKICAMESKFVDTIVAEKRIK